MKIKRINTAFLLLALAGMTLTGCSNEDIVNVNPQEGGTGNVSFSIVEKDYESADDASKSRAAAEEIKPEVQNLGNGLMAEVSLVPDTTHRAEAPKTRAINTPTHYTIQAYQGGVKKGELKGTFSGSTFTPDGGYPNEINLPHGTYDFVCFNDDVTSNGTQLTVNRSDAATARFTIQRGVVINQKPKQLVTFTMKHAGVEVMIMMQFMNYGFKGKFSNTQYVNEEGISVRGVDWDNPLEVYKFKLETPANAIPETMVYDFATNTSNYPAKSQISKMGKLEIEVPVDEYSTPGTRLVTTSNTALHGYFLPKTDCSKFKLTFTDGEVCGISLVGKSITVPDQTLVEANKRYIVAIRLYLTNEYLYADGTVGPRDKNQTKTPIAVVLHLGRRIAVALHDVKKGGSDQFQWSNATTTSEVVDPSFPLLHAATNYSELFNGDGGVPHNATIQAAEDYTPASPIPIYIWRVPEMTDILCLGTDLGRMLEDGKTYKSYFSSHGRFNFIIPSNAAATGFNPSSIDFPAMTDMTRFNNAFISEGGTPPSGTYWINNECKDGTEYKMPTITISNDGKLHLGLKSKTETAKIRPFITY